MQSSMHSRRGHRSVGQLARLAILSARLVRPSRPVPSHPIASLCRPGGGDDRSSRSLKFAPVGVWPSSLLARGPPRRSRSSSIFRFLLALPVGVKGTNSVYGQRPLVVVVGRFPIATGGAGTRTLTEGRRKGSGPAGRHQGKPGGSRLETDDHPNIEAPQSRPSSVSACLRPSSPGREAGPRAMSCRQPRFPRDRQQVIESVGRPKNLAHPSLVGSVTQNRRPLCMTRRPKRDRSQADSTPCVVRG